MSVEYLISVDFISIFQAHIFTEEKESNVAPKSFLWECPRGLEKPTEKMNVNTLI